MDIVLGISMAPDSLQMVLLQGENAYGATVDERELTGTIADDSPTVNAADRVLDAILATRKDAAAAGIDLSAVGVAFTDQSEAAVLRDALTAHELENVMLVSAFLAATALTQFVGRAMGYDRTAVLFVEPDTATLAVVETTDGSVADVRKAQLNNESAATAELLEMVAGLDELPTRPDGLFVVGSGVDITPIKPQLEEATSLAVSASEEPETALARGAALASATLFASATTALAYAQDPGTGSLEASGLPEYLSVTDAELGEDDVAYSAVTDEEASAPTVVIDPLGESAPRRGRVLLVGTAVTVAAISAALALEVALGVGLRSTVGLLPAPLQSLIAPVEQAIAPELGPVTVKKAVAPKPLSQPVGALPPAAPVPAAPAVPVPVVVPPIAPAPVPQVLLPDSPASPPVVQAPTQPSPPAESPQPIQVPPPQSPPPNQPPPEQGPQPNPGRGGGHPGNPGDGGPVNGPGPIHGAPGGGGPHGGGPVNGPGPGHGTPSGAPPEGSGPVGGGEPHSGGAGHGTPGGTPPEGSGPVGGVEPDSGSGPVGGSETPGSSGPVSGSDSGSSSSSPSDSGSSSNSGSSSPSDSGGSSNSSSPSDSGSTSSGGGE